MLPQSTAASSMPTWAKVNSTSTAASAGRRRIMASLVVEVAPPTPSICRWSGLPNSRGSRSSGLVRVSSSCAGFEDPALAGASAHPLRFDLHGLSHMLSGHAQVGQGA